MEDALPKMSKKRTLADVSNEEVLPESELKDIVHELVDIKDSAQLKTPTYRSKRMKVEAKEDI